MYVKCRNERENGIVKNAHPARSDATVIPWQDWTCMVWWAPKHTPTHRFWFMNKSTALVILPSKESGHRTPSIHSYTSHNPNLSPKMGLYWLAGQEVPLMQNETMAWITGVAKLFRELGSMVLLIPFHLGRIILSDLFRVWQRLEVWRPLYQPLSWRPERPLNEWITVLIVSFSLSSNSLVWNQYWILDLKHCVPK